MVAIVVREREEWRLRNNTRNMLHFKKSRRLLRRREGHVKFILNYPQWFIRAFKV